MNGKKRMSFMGDFKAQVAFEVICDIKAVWNLPRVCGRRICKSRQGVSTIKPLAITRVHSGGGQIQ